jgi:hypothetical protein
VYASPDWPLDRPVGDDGTVRRLLATIAFVAVLAPGSLVAGSPVAGARTDEQVTTSVPESDDIIPKPNSGTEPEDAGDRGGALQTVLFIGIVGGVLLMAAIVFRQSRKARAERGF